MHHNDNNTAGAPKKGDTFTTSLGRYGDVRFTVDYVSKGEDGAEYAFFVGGGFTRTDTMLSAIGRNIKSTPIEAIRGTV